MALTPVIYWNMGDKAFTNNIISYVKDWTVLSKMPAYHKNIKVNLYEEDR